MDCPHKIFSSHPAVLQHHYMDGKVSILISQRCLFIDFLSVPAAFGPGTLPVSGHVILVESEVELTFELDLVLIRSDIYFCLTNNFALTFSLQSYGSLLPLSASNCLRCSRCLQPRESSLFVTCASCQEDRDPVQQAKKRRIAEDSKASESLTKAISLLEDEYKLQESASQEFPSEISLLHIRSSVSKYEDEMTAACERSICCCCGEFFGGCTYQIDDLDDFIHLHRPSLDSCGYNGNSWVFCSLCYDSVRRNSVPKFSSKNLVNVTTCQNYPSVLEDLTTVEECLIAKCHPVGTILKLRPSGRSSPVNYNALRGHMIVIPQDPGPLLQILPSPELRLDNIIKVFWLGKSPPTNRNLKPFLSVRKDKVLMALHYLVQHNHLYHDLTINNTMIEDWPEEFIPPEIADNITFLENPDHREREGYTVSLQNGNYENDLDAAQDEAFQTSDQDPLITGSVYTDVNGERVDPNLRLIDALLEVVTSEPSHVDETAPASDEPVHTQRDLPTISYAIRGQATLVSAWEDPYYFTGAFPTLFPNGLGGHQEKRPVPVSLEAFAKWALNHHSRRLVFVPNCKGSSRMVRRP